MKCANCGIENQYYAGEPAWIDNGEDGEARAEACAVCNKCGADNPLILVEWREPVRVAHDECRKRAREAFERRDTKAQEFWHRLAGSLLEAAAIIEESR